MSDDSVVQNKRLKARETLELSVRNNWPALGVIAVGVFLLTSNIFGFHLIDVLWEIETVQMSSIQVPTLVIGNPDDHVVNFRVKATNAFLQLGPSPRKMLYCISTTEHPHTIASKISSPKSYHEIAQIIIGFLEDAFSSPTKASIPLSRAASVPIGLGAYGRSFPSLSDLTRPLEA